MLPIDFGDGGNVESRTPLSRRPASRQHRPSSARLAFRGILFEVWQWEQTLFDGTETVFEVLSRPDTVLVLPVLDDGLVVLAQERQPGMPLMLRTLGGRIRPGESPEEAAHRELFEESGYVAEELRLWDAWQPVNKMDWAVYLYVAHALSRPSDATLDGGEVIELQTLPAAELLERNSDLGIDDYEFLHKLYFARSDDRERKRVTQLLDPHR